MSAAARGGYCWATSFPSCERNAQVASEPPIPVSSRFGPNEWLVDEIYEQYLQDKNAVDRAWWDFFEDYSPAEYSPAAASHVATPTTAPEAPAPQTTPAAPTSPAPKADPAPAAPAPTASAPDSDAVQPEILRGAAGSGEVADGQPGGHQQPPRPWPWRQGLFHPHHRLRDRASPDHDARDGLRLHHGRRQARRAAQRGRQSRTCHRPGEGRRLTPTSRPEHQGRPAHGFRDLLGELRRRGSPSTRRETRGQRLRRHHGLAHQPGNHWNQPLHPAIDGGAGLHRRRRRDGVPRRLARRLGRVNRPQRSVKDHDAHQHLRPSHHPRCAVR